MSGPRGSWIAGGLAAVAAALFPLVAEAQATWEFTPYEVRLCLALAPAPQLPASTVTALGDAAAARAETIFGAVWRLKAVAAKGDLAALMLSPPDGLSAESILAAAEPADLAADKLYLAAIAYEEREYRIAVRELDCRTRQLGPRIERSAATTSELAWALWDALAESFAPLARIESVDGDRVVARLRAGGLAAAGSPALVEPGSALAPVVRRNDRRGEAAKAAVQPLPWTFLTVNERHDARLDCTLQSGYRAALPTRSSSRVERLALAVRPRWAATRLALAARDNPDKTLPGYEIHVRLPDSDETKLLGMTDGRGEFLVERGDGSVRVLYVRSGQQLVARLPIVAGHEERALARIVDDDRRLEAEGFIAALKSRALDLVARREILAARLRARLKEGQLDEAQALLDEFRRLPTQVDLARELDQQRRRVASPDRLTQERIDKLFVDAQQVLVLKPLSDELLNQLTRELSATRGPGKNL